MLIYQKKTFVARVTAGEYDKLGPDEVLKRINNWCIKITSTDIVIHEPVFIVDADNTAYYDYEVIFLERW